MNNNDNINKKDSGQGKDKGKRKRNGFYNKGVWYPRKNKVDNKVENKFESPIKGTSPPRINPVMSQQHIIIRSTTNPANMRIIPVGSNMPLLFNNNLMNSIFQKNQETNQPKSDENKLLHTIESVQTEELQYEELNNIETIDDLIRIGEEYNITDKKKYPINMIRLKNIVEPLKELKNVIGMESVKKNIFEQLLYLLQELNESNMMHTVIEGPPGVGKTLLGKILAKIYYKLHFLKKPEIINEQQELNNIANHLMQMLNPEGAQERDREKEREKEKEKEKQKEEEFKFKIIRRSDLVGQYVGSTAIKTQKVIDEALGGVLFIDEVYSLGSSNDKSDSFSKEAIDTLNQNLTENGDKFICIIAGYANEIDRCFFSQNEGLRRRFPFKYTIEKYDPKELAQILEFKIHELKWTLDKDLSLEMIENFIKKNKKNFENFGGDIENFLLNIKIKHSVRIFGKNPKLKKVINIDDIKSAFDVYLKAKQDKELPQFVKDMYI